MDVLSVNVLTIVFQIQLICVDLWFFWGAHKKTKAAITPINNILANLFFVWLFVLLVLRSVQAIHQYYCNDVQQIFYKYVNLIRACYMNRTEQFTFNFFISFTISKHYVFLFVLIDRFFLLKMLIWCVYWILYLNHLKFHSFFFSLPLMGGGSGFLL